MQRRLVRWTAFPTGVDVSNSGEKEAVFGWKPSCCCAKQIWPTVAQQWPLLRLAPAELHPFISDARQRSSPLLSDLGSSNLVKDGLSLSIWTKIELLWSITFVVLASYPHSLFPTMASYKQSTLSSFFQLATLLFTLITVCAGAPHIHSHVARDASPEVCKIGWLPNQVERIFCETHQLIFE